MGNSGQGTIYSNNATTGHHHLPGILQPLKEKWRQKTQFFSFKILTGAGVGHIDPMLSSDEEDFNGNVPGSESEDEGLYAFKRNRNCNYHKVSPFFIQFSFYKEI